MTQRPRPTRTSEPHGTTTTPALPLWAVACFFLSGAAGLVYEIVWSKQLAYLLGNSLHAVATVVAAFLAGLALGARVLGAPLSTRGSGARIYAVLELGVAVLGLVSLPLLRGLDPMVGSLYRALGGEGPAFALARFGLLFVLLVPPAALMGATLPVLVGAFEERRVGPGLAWLYALNTLGAVAGSVLGGLTLLPQLGLLKTTWVAAALNVAVAAVAWRAGANTAARSPAETPAQPPADTPAPASEPATTRRESKRTAIAPLSPAQRGAFVALFALSGFAALAFQIVWVRLFGLVFGSSVYSFAVVLGIYLLGIALGSAAVARGMRGDISIVAFARLELALAVCGALMLHAFGQLPQWMYDLADRAGAKWGALLSQEILITAGLLLLPCAALGAAFPIATRLLQRDDGGHATGFAYAVNTAGTIAGSLVAGFFAVPTWGVQGTQLAAVVLTVAIGLTALALARTRGESRPADLPVAAGLVVLTAVFAVFAPRWDPALMSLGTFRPVQANQLVAFAQIAGGAGSIVERASRTERVLYYREGVNGSVYVGTDLDSVDRWLRVGGKVDASTADMETQVLLGMLPAAFADSGARTLVIGLGSGITAAGVLAAGAGETDVVEIEPGVVEASHFFHDPADDPLRDPRTHLIVGDARTHLAHSGRRYDLIVSEPSNPWIAGVNSLFTVDYYRMVRAHLDSNGVFCQWMQLYELSPETFRTMLASYFSVFPDGQVFCAWGAVDLLLIAMPEGRRFALERLENPAAERLLKRSKIASPQRLAAYWSAPFAELKPIAAGAPLNRDDLPIVEYRAPRDLVEIGRSSLYGHPQVTGVIPFAQTRPDDPMFAAWTPETWYESRAQQLIDQQDAARSQRAIAGARLGGFPSLADRLERDQALDRQRRTGAAELQRAQQLLAVGSDAEARRALERATEADPSNALAWAILANQRRMVQDIPGAEAALAHIHSDAPLDARVQAAVVRGILDMMQKRPSAAAARFAEARVLNPKFTSAYIYEAEAHAADGDSSAAKEALRRGLAVLPNDPALLAKLGSYR